MRHLGPAALHSGSPTGGRTCDESPKELGSRFQLPSQFEDRRAEILARLEPGQA